MQMTMTFSFDDPGEASAFFSVFSTAMDQFRSIVSGLSGHKSAGAVDTPNVTTKTPALKAPVNEPAQEATHSPEEPATQPASTAKTTSRSKRGGARNLSEQLASGGREKVDMPATPIKAETTAKPVTADQVRELVMRLTKRNTNNSLNIVNKFNEIANGKKIGEMDQEELDRVYSKLRALEIDDEIPF